MSPSPKQFGNLLTEGIQRIHVREKRPIQIIQDELSQALNRKSPAALAYWRQGHVPAQVEEVAILARQIAFRSDVDRPWVDKFLHAAGHPNPDGILSQLFMAPTKLETTEDFPPRTFPRLVGREPLIRQALELLRTPDGPRMLGIEGLGGVGKTALAREIAQRAWQGGLFEKTIWISAATNQQALRVPAENRALTYEAALYAIGQKTGQFPSGTLTLEQTETWMRKTFLQTRTLLILDNLETASTPQEVFAERLPPLLGPGRALLTSRQRFTRPVFPLRLTGLAEEDALQFIQLVAERRNIPRVRQVPSDALAMLIRTAGGSPLALDLVVGQLQHLPISVIEDHLKRVRPLSVDPGRDEYLNLYQFIYTNTWELLTPNGRALLETLAQFAPDEGHFLQTLQSVSSLDAETLPRHIYELWLLSLLETDPDSSQPRYSLHPLTQAFVLSKTSARLER